MLINNILNENILCYNTHQYINILLEVNNEETIFNLCHRCYYITALWYSPSSNKWGDMLYRLYKYRIFIQVCQSQVGLGFLRRLGGCTNLSAFIISFSSKVLNFSSSSIEKHEANF